MEAAQAGLVWRIAMHNGSTENLFLDTNPFASAAQESPFQQSGDASMPSSPQVHLRPRKKRRSLQQTSYKRCITGLAYWGTRHLSTMRFGGPFGRKGTRAKKFGIPTADGSYIWTVFPGTTHILEGL